MSYNPTPPPWPPSADTPPPLPLDREANIDESSKSRGKHPIFGNPLTSSFFCFFVAYALSYSLNLPIALYGIANVFVIGLASILLGSLLVIILCYAHSGSLNEFKRNLALWIPILGSLALFFVFKCYTATGTSTEGRTPLSTNPLNATDQEVIKKATATAEYWVAILKQTADLTKKYPKDEMGDFLFDELASNIQALPIKTADADVVNHAMDFVDVAKEMVKIRRQYRDLSIGVERFEEHVSSPEAMAESFLRGMMGDTWGKISESLAQKKELQAWAKSLEDRRHVVSQKLATLRSNEIRLRAKLTDKYGWDFPPWLSAGAE
jgi:hypothetical protein